MCQTLEKQEDKEERQTSKVNLAQSTMKKQRSGSIMYVECDSPYTSLRKTHAPQTAHATSYTATRFCNNNDSLSFVVDSPSSASRIFRGRTCFPELILTNVTARQFQAKDAGRLMIGEDDFTRYHETMSHRRLQRADLVVWIACVDVLYEY